MIDASSCSMPTSGYNWPRRLNAKQPQKLNHQSGQQMVTILSASGNVIEVRLAPAMMSAGSQAGNWILLTLTFAR
jgi:hypothetical protein